MIALGVDRYAVLRDMQWPELRDLLNAYGAQHDRGDRENEPHFAAALDAAIERLTPEVTS